MHPHTKFGIPTLNIVGEMLLSMIILETRSDQGLQGHSDPKMVCHTLSYQDASKHQIWDSYLKLCRRYALHKNILEMRSEVKVTVCLYGLMLNLTVNSHGHVETVSAPNHTFCLKLAVNH